MNNKKLGSTITLLLILHLTFAQSSFYPSSLPKKGIYRINEQIKNNNPAQELLNAMVAVNIKTGTLGLGKGITYYRLNSESNEKFLAVCDGNSFYYQAQIKSKKYFIKAEYYGRLCYYKDVLSITDGARKTGYIFLDVQTGSTYKLNVNNLKKIIMQDSELYKRFLTETDKKALLKDYAYYFSERNKLKNQQI